MAYPYLSNCAKQDYLSARTGVTLFGESLGLPDPYSFPSPRQIPSEGQVVAQNPWAEYQSITGFLARANQTQLS